MCIICTGNYSGDSVSQLSVMTILCCADCTEIEEIPSVFPNLVFPNLRTLDCTGCTNLKRIPVFPELRQLYCSGCTKLEEIPVLPKLSRLYCSGCTELRELPVLDKLEDLCCNLCTSITQIPSMRRLRELSCDGCTRLEEISELPDLDELFCRNCRNLKKIPMKNLDELDCSDCRLLTEIPDAYVIECLGCTWVPKRNNAYYYNIKRLKTVQRTWSRKCTGRRLERIIPEVTEIYYAPGYKGFWLAQRDFEKRKN